MMPKLGFKSRRVDGKFKPTNKPGDKAGQLTLLVHTWNWYWEATCSCGWSGKVDANALRQEQRRVDAGKRKTPVACKACVLAARANTCCA